MDDLDLQGSWSFIRSEGQVDAQDRSRLKCSIELQVDPAARDVAHSGGPGNFVAAPVFVTGAFQIAGGADPDATIDPET